MGSRYGGLKQIDPIGPGGETLMDYSIYDAVRAGFGRLVFVIRRDIERPFKEIIGHRFERRIEVDYVFQELDQVPRGIPVPQHRQKPWGTGHAVLAAALAVREPFAVINADDFYGARSFQALSDHLRSGSPDYAMVGFVLRNTLSAFGGVARGVCRLGAGDYLESVVEVTGIEKHGAGARYRDANGQVVSLSGDETVSLNTWGFAPSLFEHLARDFASFLQANGQNDKAEFYLPSVVNSLIRTGQTRLKVLRTPDSWFGITYREDRAAVAEAIQALVARGEYPEKLWS